MIIWQLRNNNLVVVDEKKMLAEYIDMGFTFEDLIASKLTVKMDCQSDQLFGR
jgi:hypothetical protein